MERKEASGRPQRSGGTARWLIAVGVPVLVAVAGLVGLLAWFLARPEVGQIAPREPSPSTAAATPAPPASGPAQAPAAAAPAGGVPTVKGSWPRFRGASLDNISTDPTPLARSWPPEGPPKLWTLPMGEGYAAPAIVNSRAYVLDYDKAARADRLRCLALATGQELWSQSYAADIKSNHGMSRTVPAVANNRVVTLGPLLQVMCCDATTGQVAWQLNLVSQFGATIPDWYAGQCPLIDGNRVILAPGGTALMVAVDLASGRVVWQTPNPSGWKMTHGSVMPITFAGQREYVYCASGGVVGVSAKDGSLLWQTPDWTVSTANIPTPVPVGEGRLFLSGGYNAGSMMLGLKSADGKITPETVFRLKANVFGSQQQTPIFYQGYLYGVAPNQQLTCLDPEGNVKWSSGSTRRFGIGPYLIANGLMFVLNDTGGLTLVDPSPSGYKELARAKVLSGSEAWGPLAIAGGLLVARDLTSMVCLDVRAR